MIWWPRYTGDWARATAGFSVLEKGVYGELLDWCYTHERPLPPDTTSIWRIAGCHSAVEVKACEKVLTSKFEKTEGGWINTRCALEVAKWKTKSEKSTKAINLRWERERAKAAMIENGKGRK